MPIPYRFNPMGKSNKPVYYELAVKPSNGYNDGVTGMGVRITPKWATGGYCSIDWGDGSKEDAVTSGTPIVHVYTTMDLFTVKIKCDLTSISFGGRDYKDRYNWIDCSENWDALGGITDGTNMFDSLTKLGHNLKTLPPNLTAGYYMFRDCSKADFTFTSLPDGLQYGNSMFNCCANAQLPLTRLPAWLINGDSMFKRCGRAILPLTSLPEGLKIGAGMFLLCTDAEMVLNKLPDSLTNGDSMFYYCTKSIFNLKKLPEGLTNGQYMFEGCPNAEINLDTLVVNAPVEGWTKLTNIFRMFFGCSKVTGSRSAFLAKCPNVTNTTDAFTGTNTTE